jgi:hypothetical protein
VVRAENERSSVLANIAARQGLEEAETTYKYQVQLLGVGGRDFERLSKIATHPSLTVVQRENGTYALCSENLDALDDLEEIVALAERKVTMLNGLLEIQDAQPRSIAVGAVHTKGETRVLVGAAEVRFRRGAPDADEEARAWIALGEDPDGPAARVLRLFHRPTGSNLYAILEIIRHDVGGTDAIADRGWASRGTIERFARTFQHYASAGDESRHGINRQQPPPNPMSSRDARVWIRSLVERWLDEKGGVKAADRPPTMAT